MPDFTITKQDLMALGQYNGISDLAYAVMTTEETDVTPPVYGKVTLAGESIEIGLTPNTSEGKLSASNRTVRRVKIPDTITLTTSLAALPPDVRAEVLGRIVDANGMEVVGDSMPPYVALRYAGTRDDGSQLIRWILKARASETTVTDKTSEEGTISYQTPAIEFVAVRRADVITGPNGRAVHPLYFELDTAREGVTAEQVKAFMDDVPVFAPVTAGS